MPKVKIDCEYVIKKMTDELFGRSVQLHELEEIHNELVTNRGLVREISSELGFSRDKVLGKIRRLIEAKEKSI